MLIFMQYETVETILERNVEQLAKVETEIALLEKLTLVSYNTQRQYDTLVYERATLKSKIRGAKRIIADRGK